MKVSQLALAAAIVACFDLQRIRPKDPAEPIRPAIQGRKDTRCRAIPACKAVIRECRKAVP